MPSLHPRINAPNHPEITTDHSLARGPWRESCRYARSQYRLSDLNRVEAGAAKLLSIIMSIIVTIISIRWISVLGDVRTITTSSVPLFLRAPSRSHQEHSMPQILGAYDPCPALCVLWNVTDRGYSTGSQSEG